MALHNTYSMNFVLIDDDAICNYLTTRTIQNAGVGGEIHTALNGQQAIDLFNSYFQRAVPLPTTILLDLNMPIMDGFGFIEAFRRLPHPDVAKVKIVIVTSSSSPSDVSRAKGMGITRFLQKPLTVEALRHVLEE
jgi:CheY-like chemotaxis protein